MSGSVQGGSVQSLASLLFVSLFGKQRLSKGMVER